MIYKCLECEQLLCGKGWEGIGRVVMHKVETQHKNIIRVGNLT